MGVSRRYIAMQWGDVQVLSDKRDRIGISDIMPWMFSRVSRKNLFT